MGRCTTPLRGSTLGKFDCWSTLSLFSSQRWSYHRLQTGRVVCRSRCRASYRRRTAAAACSGRSQGWWWSYVEGGDVQDGHLGDGDVHDVHLEDGDVHDVHVGGGGVHDGHVYVG